MTHATTPFSRVARIPKTRGHDGALADMSSKRMRWLQE